MIPSIRSPDIEVRATGTEKGRGVYTLRALNPGDHAETCPVIIFLADDFNALPTELQLRVFNWGKLIDKPVGQQALALGYGSVYNFANPANLRYFASRTAETLTFVAVRRIEMGEELTINYDEREGYDPAPESVWMKRNNINPI